MKRFLVIGFFFLFVFGSCSSGGKMVQEGSSTKGLREFLVRISGQAILFGHQDDLAYGIGWKAVPGQSDVKRTSGSYPSVFGWEIGNIGDATNLDGVPFDSIRDYIQRAYRMGGINTISWHARYPVTGFDAWNLTSIEVSSLLPGGESHDLLVKELDLVAGFLASLKDDSGNPIPVIFRPWHEMYGSWFWWGSATCSSEEYRQLFRFTVDYLRNKKGLNNLLIAFSPDKGFDTKEEYLARYPGDDVVDVLGFDDYGDFKQNRLDWVVIKLGIVADLAREKGKISAFTETGSDRLEIPNWYTSNLLQVLNASEKTRNISYVLVWRNKDLSHFFVPAPDHPQSDDFRTFVNDKLIFLLDDVKTMNQ
ncbi:MAG TPA: glycosyl hydrolase [Prolixibacteraceae bacterium]|nr:glycosyl hydrolase [Prolixibacteraceae bacterium]